MHRREFLRIAGAAPAARLHLRFTPDALRTTEAALRRAPASPQQAASDEDLWRDVQNAFSVSRSMINLDNGNVCPSPRSVTESMVRNIWLEEAVPAYAIYDVELPQTITIGKGLAAAFGCSLDEVAMVRNATEALNTVLLGLDFRAGDEILTTTHDYWAMQEALDQRAVRDGVRVTRVALPVPARSMDDLVGAFEHALTPQTRLILLSHPVNLTGQFFAVKRVCEMAHAHGVEVCVDGAQGFAHMEFKRDDLDCDYFGTSLHKWLLAPIGTGMLYIRRDKIAKVWPLGAAPATMKDSMTKFMRWGTFSPAPFLAIADALAFHATVGGKRKEERLRYLTRYWAGRIQKLPNVHFLTAFDPQGASCGLAAFQIDGVDSTALQRHLQERHSIVVQSVSSRWAPEIHGIRVTPNLSTRIGELDLFCDVIEQVAAKGLPG